MCEKNFNKMKIKGSASLNPLSGRYELSYVRKYHSYPIIENNIEDKTGSFLRSYLNGIDYTKVNNSVSAPILNITKSNKTSAKFDKSSAKRCSSENQINGRSSVHKYSGCPNVGNTIGDTNAAVPTSTLGKTNCSTDSSFNATIALNILRAKKKYRKFDHTNIENEVLESNTSKKECKNIKNLTFKRSFVNEYSSCSNGINNIRGNPVQNVYRCQPEINSACAVETTFLPKNKKQCISEVGISRTISENVTDYLNKKRAANVIVDYLQGFYQRRLCDIDSLESSNFKQKVDIYKEWGLLLQKMNESILRNIKNLVDQCEKERVRVKKEKKKHDHMKREYEHDVSQLVKICTEAYKTGKWNIDCDFKTFDKKDLLDPKVNKD